MTTLKLKKLGKDIKKNIPIYLFILIPLIFIIIFSYVPMYGVILAFKDYDITGTISNSPWVGLKHFRTLFEDILFWRAFKNTLIISFGQLIFCFPVPIILALLINEMRFGKLKKVYQILFTFPNFLSWVVVAGIVKNVVGSDGVLNMFLGLFGVEKQQFLMNPNAFLPILFISNIWKSAGYSAIIYMGAISAIPSDLYEAAKMDGASRFAQMYHITFKFILPTVVIMLILALGGIMNAGFDPIFNLSNPAIKSTSEIIDTYIYSITFDSTMFDFGYSTAAGLFKSLINFALLLFSNKISKLLGGSGIV
jgi:putative aldouronate transport system permease protein